nr:CPBP family glutamic-type intramembrane protease [Actinokineospora enzanensis]
MVAAVAALTATTVLANRVVAGWAYPLCGVGATALLLGLARWCGLGATQVGLGQRTLRRAALFGLFGSGIVALLLATALIVPPLRPVFTDGRVGTYGVGTLLWIILLRIPLGTVLIKEVAFRGVLPALLGPADRWRRLPALTSAALFGLWHALPSLALTRNAAVAATFPDTPLWIVSAVAMTAAAAVGLLLHWCRHIGQGVLTPILIHLTLNCGGLLTAWLLHP